MGAIVEINHDEKGIIWPEKVAPFLVHLISIGDSKKVQLASQKLYTSLLKENIDVIYDDRKEKSVGEKFAESDLMGIPYRVIVSEKTLKTNSIELKKRNEKQARLVKIKQLNKIIS